MLTTTKRFFFMHMICLQVIPQVNAEMCCFICTCFYISGYYGDIQLKICLLNMLFFLRPKNIFLESAQVNPVA